jgi:RNA polymerase sigma factor (sigma-70 family)
VYQIARRRTVDWMRHRRSDAPWDLSPTDPAPPGPDPLDKVLVDEGLAMLTERERRLLDLAYRGGMTQREIAELLGVPEGTVKTWAHRALAILRRIMGDGADLT